MDGAIEDIEFLARSDHRVDALAALAAGPCDRAGLRDATRASAPTVGRILSDFADRGWTVRDGPEYRLTATGAYVAEHFGDLVAHVALERRFRDVWQWLPGTDDALTIPPSGEPGETVTSPSGKPGRLTLDLLADAVVTTAEPGDPYAPATRCGTLFRESARMKGFDAGLTAPHHFDALYQRIVDGMDVELVLPESVLDRIREAYPERAAAVGASGNLTLWRTDALPPYRLTVFDDRVGVGGYDPENGIMRVYVDSDAPALRDWAERAFEAVRRSARLGRATSASHSPRTT